MLKTNFAPLAKRTQLEIPAIGVLILLLIVLNGCTPTTNSQLGIAALSVAPMPGEMVDHEPIRPLSKELPEFGLKEQLGKRLFHEKELSAFRNQSCATCHNLDKGGIDTRPQEKIAAAQKPDSPTVYNCVLNFKQFWDGRRVEVTEQIKFNLNVMGLDPDSLVNRLHSHPEYRGQFERLFANGVTYDNVVATLAAFQSSLITPSRFDRFLLGEEEVLTADEKQGYLLFKKYGCSSCHQGVNIGGNMFQKIGVMVPYFDGKRKVRKMDLGRFAVTGVENDKHVFKVPSLRNIALTAPYMHDRSLETLEETIRIMAKHQLGRSIPEQDVALITSFLHSLTGEALESQKPAS